MMGHALASAVHSAAYCVKAVPVTLKMVWGAVLPWFLVAAAFAHAHAQRKERQSR